VQLFVRPSPPGGLAKFEQDVKLFREKIEAIFSANESSATGAVPAEGEAAEKKKVKFSPKWREYKSVFAEAQYGKCGYCEMMVIGGQPGDVDHYFPKGAVWRLYDDPSKWGQEGKWASTVKGRLPHVISEQGYWWLAYEWSNYLLTCMVCNEYWKLSYFPVENDRRHLPPSAQTQEVPLLLNPFDASRNPAEHLRFSDFGQIEAKDNSPFGYETIRTCGLDRESLRRAREWTALRVYKLARELNAATDERVINEKLRDFYHEGRDDRIHSGMARAIFEDLCGLSWAQLKKLVGGRENTDRSS
jgi:hypothetical protein